MVDLVKGQHFFRYFAKIPRQALHTSQKIIQRFKGWVNPGAVYAVQNRWYAAFLCQALIGLSHGLIIGEKFSESPLNGLEGHPFFKVSVLSRNNIFP